MAADEPTIESLPDASGSVVNRLVEGGFTSPINIMVIDSRSKGYLARIGTEDLRPVH